MSYIKSVPGAANCVRIETSAVGSMSTSNQGPNNGAPLRSGRPLPDWLDGRTVALATTVVTATLTLGAMMQTAHSRLASDIHQVRQDLSADIENVRDGLSADIEKVRDELSADIEKVRDELSADIEKVRDELSADIAKLDDRLRAVEIDVAAIRTATTGFDARLQTVEEHVRHPVGSPPPS